jgi:tRNA U34 2-thiouridine synthase MnmA/TrmU
LPDGSRALVCAADADRDQSYFLFATTREQLDFLRFPLGDMTKAQTRELARRFDLAIADKQDSQDICFVPAGKYTDVIERLKPGAVEPGEIVDLQGRVLGQHQGIIHYTVGQRKGLGIASGAPLYVVRLMPARVVWAARGAADGSYPAARRQLDRRRSAGPRHRRRHRDVRARALDRRRSGGCSGARAAMVDRRRRRVARTGLRVRRATARARSSAAASSAQHVTEAAAKASLRRSGGRVA